MVTMRYDAAGRRVELVTRPNGGTATTVTFRYQGDALAQELTGGSVTRTYVTDETGGIVKVCDPDCTGSNPQHLVTWNGHGDAQALWRINADGTLTLANSYTYSTWGTPTTATHNGAGDLGFRFRYVGRFGVAWDNAFGLGLAHMGVRHYSPALGRFLQPDPSALEANLYAYSDNSPVTKIDPSGLSWWYKVRQGDTLTKIVNRWRVSRSLMYAWNQPANLSKRSEILVPGMCLFIPARLWAGQEEVMNQSVGGGCEKTGWTIKARAHVLRYRVDPVKCAGAHYAFALGSAALGGIEGAYLTALAAGTVVAGPAGAAGGIILTTSVIAAELLLEQLRERGCRPVRVR